MDLFFEFLAKRGLSKVLALSQEHLLGFSSAAKMQKAIASSIKEVQWLESCFLWRLAQRMGANSMEEALEWLSQVTTTDETLVLVSGLLVQAVRSPTLDRKKLMTATMAGLCRPDLDLEMKMRIAQAVERLQPSDALHLLAVADHADVPRPQKTLRLTGEQMEQWRSIQKSREDMTDALLLVGCIRTPTERDGGTSSRYLPTKLGLAVLDTIRGWDDPEVPCPPASGSG